MKNLERNINRYRIKHEKNNSYVGVNRKKVIDASSHTEFGYFELGPTFSQDFFFYYFLF